MTDVLRTNKSTIPQKLSNLFPRDALFALAIVTVLGFIYGVYHASNEEGKQGTELISRAVETGFGALFMALFATPLVLYVRARRVRQFKKFYLVALSAFKPEYFEHPQPTFLIENFGSTAFKKATFTLTSRGFTIPTNSGNIDVGGKEPPSLKSSNVELFTDKFVNQTETNATTYEETEAPKVKYFTHDGIFVTRNSIQWINFTVKKDFNSALQELLEVSEKKFFSKRG
jgi:hypothetical protein